MAKLKGIPREKNNIVYLIYAVIVAIMFVVGIFVGVSMDNAMTINPDTGKATVDFKSMEQPQISISVLKEHLDIPETNTKKMGAIFAFAAFLLIAHFGMDSRRLHRKGEEHGSARWALSAEKKSLEDKIFRLTKHGKKINKLIKKAENCDNIRKSEKLRKQAEKIKMTKRWFYYSGVVPIKYIELKEIENV